MNVYLASRFSRIEEMREYAEQLASHGIGVTSRWIRGGHEMPAGATGFSADEWDRFAIEDIEDIQNADVFVTFTEHPGAPGRARGGRHVEYGIALALHTPIIIIGPRENVFHWIQSPSIRVVDRWDQAFDILRGVYDEGAGAW